MANRGAGWIVSVVVLNSILVPPGAAGQAVSVRGLLDKYTRALDATQSFIDAYEATSEYSFNLPQAGSPMPQGKKFMRGRHRADGRRTYHQTYCWGDFNSRERNLPESTPRYHLRIEADGALYVHATAVNHPRVKGRVYLQPAFTDTAAISRQPYSAILGFVGADERLDQVLRRARRISVRVSMEDVNGSACHVIDAQTEYGSCTVWLDPQHGGHAARVTLRATGGQKVYESTLPQGESQTVSVDNVRFEQVGGVWVPMEGTEHQAYVQADPEFFSREQVHFKRTRITLNPDHEASGSFVNPLENPAQDPELKDGTSVVISSPPNPSVKAVWQDGKIVDGLGKVIETNLLKARGGAVGNAGEN